MIERSKVLQTITQFFGLKPVDADPDRPISEFFRQKISHDMTIDVCKKLADCGLMLAGGAINSIFTGTQINDLDFYIKNKDNLDKAIDLLKLYFPNTDFTSDNAISMSRSCVGRRVRRVQLIKRFSGMPEEILDCFDFTITQGLFDFETDSFTLGERFLQDIARRRLVYLGKSHFPICAMYRTLKYQSRGYTLPGSTIMHIALSIVRLNIKTYKDLKYQLMGIDTMYLQGLLGSGKFADELPVNYGEFLAAAFNTFDGEEHDVAEFDSEVFKTSWVEPIVQMTANLDGSEHTVGDTQ